MVAAAPNLPELSPGESELLAAFLILRYDLVALAEQYKLLPQQLLAFAHSPAVNAHLAALKSFSETAFTLRHLEARVKSLDILEKIATTSESQIEQRRAASTIFRGIGLQRDRQSEPSGASRRPPSSPPGGGGPALRAGGGSVPTPPTHAPSSSSEQPHPPPHDSHPSSLPTHHSSLSPSELFPQIADSLARPAHAAAALQALAGAAITINHKPQTPADIPAALALLPKGQIVQIIIPSSHHHNPGPPETARSHVLLVRDGGRCSTVFIELTRAADTWLISAIDIEPNTS